MVEIIVGFIIYWILFPKDDSEFSNTNDEIIRPILMDNFDDFDGE